MSALKLFEHSNFGGASQDLDVGQFEGAVLTLGDKRISSVRVPWGWTVTLYRQPGFLDTAVHLIADASALGGFKATRPRRWSSIAAMAGCCWSGRHRPAWAISRYRWRTSSRQAERRLRAARNL